jgi:hypothetical protein
MLLRPLIGPFTLLFLSNYFPPSSSNAPVHVFYQLRFLHPRRNTREGKPALAFPTIIGTPYIRGIYAEGTTMTIALEGLTGWTGNGARKPLWWNNVRMN